MKNVYLYADSSPGVGLGHVKRCESLLLELRKNNCNVVFTKISLEKFDYIFWESIKNSVVILDSHQELSTTVSILKKNNNSVIILDNFFMDQRDLSINVFNHSKAINKTFAGFQYMIIRDEVLLKRNTSFVIEDYSLISIGGEDYNNVGERIALEIKSYFPKVILVYGPLAKMTKKLEGVTQVSSPENYVELLMKSKLIFCNAGSTLFEGLLLKKNCIAIPQTKFEESIANEFLNKKYILSIGTKNIESTLIKLDSFLVPTLEFEGNGAIEINKIIKEYL